MSAQDSTIETPLLLRSIRGENIVRPPVWLMRQAGRYMEEYRALKAEHGFLGLCRSPELAVEVSLQPIDYLDPDAAIIFSDILIPAELLGFSVEFAPGPVVANALRSPDDLKRVKRSWSFASVSYVTSAISQLRKELESRACAGSPRKAVIGFCGSPWTMACYLINQEPYKGFQGTKVFASLHRKTMHSFLEILSDLLGDYLCAQAEAGADVVQIFDSWGGILSEEQYLEFGAPYIERMISKMQEANVPVALYTNGGDHLLSQITNLKPDIVSLDWRTNIGAAEAIVGDNIALQGNLDPSALFCEGAAVAAETSKMLRSMSRRSKFIANLGHGVLQKTPPENAKMFVDTVKSGWER